MLTNSLSMSNDFAVTVETTDNRGFTPEEVAVRCVNRIIGISDNAPPAIRDQANAYRKELEAIVPSGTFTDGETITGATSGATTTVTSTGADTTISWLSENAEIALLYGTLIEASVYMKEEQDIMAMYSSRFAEAMSRLKNLGEAKEVTDQYRTGEIIRQKT